MRISGLSFNFESTEVSSSSSSWNLSNTQSSESTMISVFYHSFNYCFCLNISLLFKCDSLLCCMIFFMLCHLLSLSCIPLHLPQLKHPLLSQHLHFPYLLSDLLFLSKPMHHLMLLFFLYYNLLLSLNTTFHFLFFSNPN